MPLRRPMTSSCCGRPTSTTWTRSTSTDDIWTETADDAPVTADSDEDQPSADDLAMTPIETWDEAIVAEVPADVTDAVKRAIAALERITQETARRAADPAAVGVRRPARAGRRPGAAPFSGFAPPTLDMSAEAIYARMTAQMQADVAVERVDRRSSIAMQPVASRTTRASGPTMTRRRRRRVRRVRRDRSTPRDGGSNERSSALRRLIGSLRRKDR